jgi:hypothetical protein
MIFKRSKTAKLGQNMIGWAKIEAKKPPLGQISIAQAGLGKNLATKDTKVTKNSFSFLNLSFVPFVIFVAKPLFFRVRASEFFEKKSGIIFARQKRASRLGFACHNLNICGSDGANRNSLSANYLRCHY